MQEWELTWQEKLEEAKWQQIIKEENDQEEKLRKIKQMPHLININEDKMLDWKQAYGL